MSTNDPDPAVASELPQGSLDLLDTEVAQSLLASAVPARVAYVAKDGTPRVIPTWFHWTGEELVMPTFVRAPHVQRPARRLDALRARPDVAITIDTNEFPPNVLLIRGRATVTEVEGVDPDYAASARRYMGEEAVSEYLAFLDEPVTTMARIAVRPAWVGVLDFETRVPGGMAG